MNNELKDAAIKVPAITLGFWIVKILATTLGETGGDALSMSLGLGYLTSTAIFGAIFVLSVIAQIRAKAFHPAIYWLTIVATTTVGTTMADYTTRDPGIGYSGGSAILLAGVLISLFIWRRTTGTISVESVSTPTAEAFYWLTIMFSQTLGTALGDWFADTADLGYLGAAGVFGLALAVLYGLWRMTNLSRAAIFWAAFVITRPLGAVVGDFLDKPLAMGGLNLSRFAASGVLIAAMAALIILLPQRPAEKLSVAH